MSNINQFLNSYKFIGNISYMLSKSGKPYNDPSNILLYGSNIFIQYTFPEDLGEHNYLLEIVCAWDENKKNWIIQRASVQQQIPGGNEELFKITKPNENELLQFYIRWKNMEEYVHLKRKL